MARAGFGMMDTAPDACAALSLGDMEESVSFMLRMAELAAFEAVSALGAEAGLSLPEQTVIVTVAANPDARQGAVADTLRIRWPNMTKLVSRLEERGLIVRAASPGDRRAVRLRLTPQGDALAETLKARLVRHDHEALPMLESAEREQLVRLLRKVAGWP